MMEGFFSRIRFYARLGFAAGLFVLRNRELRRKLMFVVSIVAMLSVFIGGVVIDGLLVGNLWWFVLYWFASGTVVVLMVLLALYDMLRVKIDQAQSERDELLGLLAEMEEAAAADVEAGAEAKEEAEGGKRE